MEKQDKIQNGWGPVIIIISISTIALLGWILFDLFITPNLEARQTETARFHTDQTAKSYWQNTQTSVASALDPVMLKWGVEIFVSTI
jgi:hypothetical protein